MKQRTLYIVGAGLIVLTALPFAMLKAQTRSDHSTILIPSPSPHVRINAEPAALALWKRLREASGPDGTPITADMVVTNFAPNGKVRRQVKLTMQEGPGERYRLTYNAPDNVRGRIVVFDGKTLYQYEPARNTVLKRPVQSDEAALMDTDSSDVVTPVLEGPDTILGHPVQKLALKDHLGRTIRRCYIDENSGRSLRTEEYSPDNQRLVRRVEKTRFALATDSDPSLFEPDFPTSARVLSSTTRRGKNLQVEKANLGLPVKAGNFRLQTVLHPAAKATGESARQKMHQAIYANGVQTVSVFVTLLSSPAVTLATPEGNGWQRIEVGKGEVGFARQDERGRTGVVWLREGRRYVMASRLPLNDALSVARDLYKNM